MLEAILRPPRLLMGDRDAFGPNLRRIRLQRGISINHIAEVTKVNVDLWMGLERNDFSRWPSGVYARAYIREYASQIGADPDATVDEFCRWFVHGDRRAERLVREHAAIVGHSLAWRDDLTPGGLTDRRASRSPSERPALSIHQSRLLAALGDIVLIGLIAVAIAAAAPVRRSTALAIAAIGYHAVALVVLGCTPLTWVLHMFAARHHPGQPRPPARLLWMPERTNR
jgi:hypothetical protein